MGTAAMNCKCLKPFACLRLRRPKNADENEELKAEKENSRLKVIAKK
jgi:hypothetical protein